MMKYGLPSVSVRPSNYAVTAKAMGFELITWTLPSGIIVAVSLWLVDISHMSSVFYLLRPSNYAVTAKAMGFELITWTLERSGLLATGGGWYYETSNDYTKYDGDALHLTDTLAREVKKFIHMSAYICIYI